MVPLLSYVLDRFGYEELVASMESQLLRRCDVFVATSTKLLSTFVRPDKTTLLLTHGVDAQLFSDKTLSEHGLLTNIPKPRVGYFGLFDDSLPDGWGLLLMDRHFRRDRFVVGGHRVDGRTRQDLDAIEYASVVQHARELEVVVDRRMQPARRGRVVRDRFLRWDPRGR